MREEHSTPTVDTVIRGGLVVQETMASVRDIAVKDGRIHAIAEPGTSFSANAEISAHGRIVVPGGIDTHTHIAWPLASTGATSRDTFATATAAAALSGTTTVIDFVPPPQGVSVREAAEARLAQASGQCMVDYTFHPIITDSSARTLREIGELVHMGMSSFKVFTTYEGMRLTDGEIFDVMRAISEAGGLPGFHAENHEVVSHAVAKVTGDGHGAISDFAASRPQVAEVAAIQTVAAFARDLGTPMFVYHVSGAEGVAALTQLRAEGIDVRAETCTHYLAFDASVYLREDAWMYVICPPIREEGNADALWNALKSGTLQCVGSDHCAYGTEHKHPGEDDFLTMEAGAPGIEARMPFVWSRGVSQGRLSLVEFAQVTATGPAQTFGLYPRKGVIAVGSDADLVLIDPDRSWTWPVFDTGWGSDFEPYAGLDGTGLAEMTMLRGEVVARDGAVLGPRHGAFVGQTPVAAR